MTLTVGYAQTIITPALDQPVYLAGFGRNRRAQSVHDDLFVRALALNGAGATVVLTAADLIGLTRHVVQEIEGTVQRIAPAAQLIIAATHTHHGPDTLGLWGPDEVTRGVDEEYLAHLQQVIAATALDALQHMQPADLRTASVQVTGVARNARDPKIRDEELSCLQFVAAGHNKPHATLLVYPCHPEVLWDDNPHITADYLASMRRVVEHVTGAPCLGMVGALGGMMTPAMPGNTFEDAERMGVILGEAALAALTGARPHAVDYVGYRRHVYDLPLDNPLFQLALQAGLLTGLLNDGGTLTTEAGLLRLGDTAIFFMPGEVLPRLGLTYKAQMRGDGIRHAVLVGLANDELGYILPADDFVLPDDPFEPGEHYEESMSVGIEAGPALSAALSSLLA
ncbi:MAG: hypothetical protein M9936_26935 [Caldilinea sp.]|nr:hypothetical protein [Caldilinea sp.]MCB0068573.1 hypothetical protein [Caldilineaceae bacterium]MCB0039962.1 hypothetical protein [Caldilinea sp.]MCB0049773.1 hypothetical protein [Caldilinea sp.]MCB0147217.1 hypothetical protein [Caldilineaceae bacterium]